MPLSDPVGHCDYCLDDEIERLSEDAGEQKFAQDVDLSNPAITITSRYCVKCNRRFCAVHASPVDQSDMCFACLPFEAVAEMKTPLITQTEEGNHVLRKGYRLVPTGIGYKTLPQAITGMTDDELKAYIAEKAIQIQNVERQRDFLRVAQSTAKLEMNDREVAAARALAGYKIKLPTSSPGIKITGKANGSLKGVAGAGSLDLAEFIKFAAANLAKIRAAKASPQAPAGVPPAVAAPGGSMLPSEKVKPSGEGGGAPPSPASQDSGDVIAQAVEDAREAEIEDILRGGEPKNG